jgi:hypothetical protein
VWYILTEASEEFLLPSSGYKVMVVIVVLQYNRSLKVTVQGLEGPTPYAFIHSLYPEQENSMLLSDTSITIYQTTRRHIPEDNNSQNVSLLLLEMINSSEREKHPVSYEIIVLNTQETTTRDASLTILI